MYSSSLVSGHHAGFLLLRHFANYRSGECSKSKFLVLKEKRGSQNHQQTLLKNSLSNKSGCS